MTYQLALDAQGAPVLLAPAVEAAPEEEKAKQEQEQRTRSSAARRRDAVVDAARTLDDLSASGVESFVRQRWRGDRAVTTQDFESFAVDARAQRLDDVVDAIDHRIRKAVHGRAGTKRMHVSLPRGIGAKSLASLEAEEVAQVIARLRDRGWSDQQISRHGVRRLDKDGKVKAAIGGQDG